MNTLKSPLIYIEINQNNTSKIINLTDQKVPYFEEQYLLNISGIPKKQLDLYLFRHKEIEVLKHGKLKLISFKILGYIFRNLKNKIS